MKFIRRLFLIIFGFFLIYIARFVNTYFVEIVFVMVGILILLFGTFGVIPYKDEVEVEV